MFTNFSFTYRPASQVLKVEAAYMTSRLTSAWFSHIMHNKPSSHKHGQAQDGDVSAWGKHTSAKTELDLQKVSPECTDLSN